MLSGTAGVLRGCLGPPAVYEQSVTLLSQDRHKLVHDAAGDAGMAVFRLLACQRLRHLVPVV